MQRTLGAPRASSSATVGARLCPPRLCPSAVCPSAVCPSAVCLSAVSVGCVCRLHLDCIWVAPTSFTSGLAITPLPPTRWSPMERAYQQRVPRFTQGRRGGGVPPPGEREPWRGRVASCSRPATPALALPTPTEARHAAPRASPGTRSRRGLRCVRSSSGGETNPPAFSIRFCSAGVSGFWSSDSATAFSLPPFWTAITYSQREV